MIIVSFVRTMKYALSDVGRNFWLSVATVSVLVLTLLTIHILVVFNFFTNTAISIVEDKLDVSVFFRPEVSDTDILAIKDELSIMPEVELVSFLSKEKRIQDFQNEYANDPAVSESLEEISNNPFGSALIIKAKETSGYEIILSQFSRPEYEKLVEEKDYKDHQAVIEKISGITNKARRAGEVMSLVFAVIAVLIVFNTIRVAIYTHREEIGIMKSVGATNWFVKFPYVMESVVFSIVALVLTFLIWYPILGLMQPYVNGFFGQEVSLVAYFSDNLWRIGGLELIGVMAINILSSTFAMGRYLKV